MRASRTKSLERRAAPGSPEVCGDFAAVKALGARASLVLPSGWFKPRREVELFADAPHRVRFTEALERGADFERIVYESA